MTMNNPVKNFKSKTDYTADKAKAGIDDASSSIKDAANKLGQKADDAVQFASQAYHDTKDVAQQNFGDLESQIRARPVQAMVIAAGAGLLFRNAPHPLKVIREKIAAIIRAGGFQARYSSQPCQASNARDIGHDEAGRGIR
jgi:ElaB/YqjD/DUF883 family membrane-anchored ribosome-binding protein